MKCNLTSLNWLFVLSLIWFLYFLQTNADHTLLRAYFLTVEQHFIPNTIRRAQSGDSLIIEWAFLKYPAVTSYFAISKQTQLFKQAFLLIVWFQILFFKITRL